MVLTKDISLTEARQITKKFCDDMEIILCGVYYVDSIGKDIIGHYIYLDPPHILMIDKAKNKLTLLMHELIHHLDAYGYYSYNLILNHSSKEYIKAKRRTVTWCRNNISDKPDWNKMLRHKFNICEIKNFNL